MEAAAIEYERDVLPERQLSCVISPMSYQILADMVPSALPALTLPIHMCRVTITLASVSMWTTDETVAMVCSLKDSSCLSVDIQIFCSSVSIQRAQLGPVGCGPCTWGFPCIVGASSVPSKPPISPQFQSFMLLMVKSMNCICVALSKRVLGWIVVPVPT